MTDVVDLVLGLVLVALVPARHALAKVEKRFSDPMLAGSGLVYGALVGGTSGTGVLLIAILLAFSAAGWRDPMSRLLLAHVVITLPYMVRTVMASLARLDPLAEEAAMTLGASRLRAFFHVTLPLLLPGLVAGAVFAFIVSFDNVSVSLFLTTARSLTLPIAVLGYVEFNFDPSVAALSTLLILTSLVAAIGVERAVGLRRALGH